MFRVISGILLGWGLGANDSANVFGTAVSSRMVKYRTAALLTAIFVILGALLQGDEGMETVSSLSHQNINSAFITSLSAAITVIIMTILKLPISTSQAVVGAIIGAGILRGVPIDTHSLTKILLCWILTPIGGLFFTVVFYYLFAAIFRFFRVGMIQSDTLLRAGLIIAGSYGAYALGANNVANVTGVYVGSLLTVQQAVIIGAVSIALGVLTYSKNVMLTVGKSIVKLDAFSAFITVFAQAVTVHIFAIVGVPVSTSQAIVGAVLGIGVIKNIEAINVKMVIKVFSGWLFTPTVAFIVSLIISYFYIHIS